MGLASVTSTGGNPGHRLFWNNLGQSLHLSAINSTNPVFIGDYSQKGPVRLSMDFKVDLMPFSETLVVSLTDVDTFNGAPAASVWKIVGGLSAGMPWTRFTTTVPNVDSPVLPAGWQGAGAGVGLPPGRTWANVLQGVDYIRFTTLVPGQSSSFNNYIASIDNAAIEPLHPPCAADLNLSGTVDGTDLGILLGAWGSTGLTPPDLSGDEIVDALDLDILLSGWGKCPTGTR